jgi:hypothetical protein
MAKVSIGSDTLKVTLTTGEKWAAIRGDLTIDGKTVRGAQVIETDFWRNLGWRVPGTGLPPYIVAGTYLKKGDRAFVSWRGKTTPVQINLDGSGRYTRLIIGIQGTDEAAALAERINLAVSQS